MKSNLRMVLIFSIFFADSFTFAENTQVPEMPIPPEFQQPQQALPSQRPPQPVAQPAAQPPSQFNQMTPPQNPPAQMPSDFELIAIKPYFKNKPKMGHLTATLYSATNDVLGSVAGDFGDCQQCIRGASVKGKLGVRLYGNEVNKLTVSRKQSNSIQITACQANNNMAFVNNVFSCEFMHNNMKMKLTLKLDI